MRIQAEMHMVVEEVLRELVVEEVQAVQCGLMHPLLLRERLQ